MYRSFSILFVLTAGELEMNFLKTRKTKLSFFFTASTSGVLCIFAHSFDKNRAGVQRIKVNNLLLLVNESSSKQQNTN